MSAGAREPNDSRADGESGFRYGEAFGRNLGWLRAEEQESLRGRRVAIAGMGGVGGGHFLALTRLGVGAFTVADLDRFDFPNFNRQTGASVGTVGQPKVDVLAAMAHDINPGLQVRRFSAGVTAENLDNFLDGADLFVDGFDFFEIGIRRRTFSRCRELGIPAITAAPIGMGVGLLVFMPGRMSFEQYFRFEGRSTEEQYLRFLMGVAPRGLHRTYLVDPSRVDLAKHRGPSTGAACLLCSGAVAATAARILLQRGGIAAAPVHHHYDGYRQVYARSRLPLGNAGPLQRLKLAVARRQLAGFARAAGPPPPTPTTAIEAILEAARWAPSGDNAQPWRFALLGPEAVRVRIAHDPASPYEYRGGEPTQLSGGMMLEALAIAASAHGRTAAVQPEPAAAVPTAVVRFAATQHVAIDPLYAMLPLRSVDRRPYRRRPLTPHERASLEGAVGPGLSVRWHEGDRARFAFARAGAHATSVRLRLPEAYPVHRRSIDWAPGDSETGIPAAATGLWRPTLPVMRWAMRDWRRMSWVNRLGGAGSAALQLDWVPAIGSAAFFTVALRDGVERDTQTLWQAGRGLLRFWLAASRLGLAVQPGLAILMFAHYGRTGVQFTADPALRQGAARCAEALRRAIGEDGSRLLFLGRIGEPGDRPPGARSVRRPLAALIEDQAAATASTDFQSVPSSVT